MQLENFSNEPAFKRGDIVYLKPIPRYDHTDWPAIGTPSEIDCKILEDPIVQRDIIGTKPDGSAIEQVTRIYNFITGRGIYFHNIDEKNLVSPKDKHLYIPSGYFTITQDTELCPKDTVFLLNGEWYSNEDIGLYIHISRATKIKGLFLSHKPLKK